MAIITIIIINIIKFVLISVFNACMGWLDSYVKLPSISVFGYILADFPFFQITFDHFHVFLGQSLGKLPLTLKVLHLLDQALSSIQSRWPNNSILLSCKHFHILFNFSLIGSSSAQLLFSDLMLDIHLTILSFHCFCRITSSSLNGKVSLPYSITLRCVKYNLLSAAKGKLFVKQRH